MLLALVIGVILIGTSAGLMARAVAVPRLRALKRLEDVASYGLERGDVQGASEQRSGARSPVSCGAGVLGELAARRISRIDLDKIRRQLLAAGYYRARPEAFVGYRLLGGAVAALLWVLSAGPTARGILMAALLAVAAWFIPGYLLARRGGRRGEEIEDALPALVDLLVVTVEAGLSFSASLQMASRRIDGPLGDELRLAQQEQRMGLPVSQALENMLHRCDTPAMRSFVRSVTQGETLGVSIGSIMRGLAIEMRQRRKARAEERAHKAPVKMLFPLIFLIFPVVFIVILGPAVINIMESFSAL
jgi:tight adherence protein C